MLVLTVALSIHSCDFVRSQLGMPTSVQISEMRKEQFRQKEAERTDSIARVDALNAAIAEAKHQSEMNRFHIIVGSFLMEENAERMMARLTNSGFNPVEMRFRNGFLAISAASYDNYREAYAKMYYLLEQIPYAPYDIWIYDLKQNLHRGTNDYSRMRSDDYRIMKVNEDYRMMNVNEEYRRLNEMYRQQNENNRVYP